MHILCLTGWFPYPADNGARIRLYHLLRELGKAHRIDLISFTRPGEIVDAAVLGTGCRLLGVVPWRPFQPARLRALVGLFSPYPRSLADTYSAEMAQMVGEALSQSRYDLVLAFEIGPGILTSRYVRHVHNVPKVMEDLELSMIQAVGQSKTSRLVRWRYALTWWKQRRYAAGLLRAMDGCTVPSEVEKRVALDVLPAIVPVEVVPNGVAWDWYAGDFGPVEAGSLVFPGALTYEANFAAMDFFLERVFPRIRSARPGATLRITGRHDGVDVGRLSLGEDVILTGYLDDIRPAVAQSSVCVVPLQVGGGTRLKILEAMALGTPVVATAKGAEGLDVTHGSDILLADEPEAFAEAVVRLLDDGALRSRLGGNGRRLVRERYSWSESARRLDRFLCQVVEEWERTV